MSEPDSLLEKGFQLAYFLVPHRSVAVQILAGALNKLRVQRSHESKRTYWRDKYLKRWISKISRGDQDTLQWLIQFESDHYEKRQEQFGRPTNEDMVVRYIKSLVQMTTAMSSFHVNVGLRRLLQNYSTAETQQFYELITERFLGADEYRRAKSLLMRKLETRFGRFLKNVRTHHGEVRFEIFRDQTHWTEFVQKCLKQFVPWSTEDTCLLPVNFELAAGILPQLIAGHSTVQGTKHDQDGVELRRCHTFIDPNCFGRLCQVLGFDPPERKLAVPWFHMQENNNPEDNSGNPRQTSPLTENERRNIDDVLSANSSRRAAIKPRFLKVTVDGIERVRIDLDQLDDRRFEIQEGAKLIEIWSDDKGQEILLAAHLVAYGEWEGIAPSTAAIVLRGVGDLVLSVSPKAKIVDDAWRASVSLRCHPGTDLAAWRDFGTPLWHSFRSVAAIAAIAVLAAGWSLSTLKYRREIGAQRSVLDQVQRELALDTTAHVSLRQNSPRGLSGTAVTTYRLVPDDSILRGKGSSGMLTIKVPVHPSVVNLDIPLASENHTLYRAVLMPFLGKQEILTLTLRRQQQSGAGSLVTFSLPSCLVEDNHDYIIKVSYLTRAGAREEFNSFSFHVNRKIN